jgi:hypothetical protein
MPRDRARNWWNGVISTGVAVLLIAWATRASAQTLIVRNDASTAVVVQVVSVCRGVYRRDRPYLLRPGDVTTPGILLPGDKIITVYDATIPNRVLFHGALPARPLDQYFRLLPAAPLPRLRMQPWPSSER